MQVRHKSVLVKEVKIEGAKDIIGPSQVDHYEVCFKSEDIKDIKKGDHVYFRAMEGKVTFKGQEYIVVTDENIKVIL